MADSARIAILLPDLRPGGAERVCIYLANAFVARGVAVDMVLMRAEGELLPLLDSRLRVVGLGASRVRRLAWPLARYLRERRPTAVLANMWPLTMMAVAVTRMVGAQARVVVVEHTHWSAVIPSLDRLTRTALRWSMRRLMPRADVRVGVSGGVARDLECIAGLPAEAVRTVYNPITGFQRVIAPPESVEYAPRWWGGDHQRIIAVGTLKQVKRFDRLIEAFARLPDSAARLLILGEGEERPALEALADRLGVRDRLDMPGFVPEPAPLLRKADLFVLSSDYEGFGNVVVEAMEQGVPVVSTDCPSGPREILEDGKYGTLVPVGDVDALAFAMQQALSREHDHEALKRRAQDFSVDKAADAYLDLLLPGWRIGASA
jgi:glycosyltransferase involved in cell wall biosynthesis